MLNYLIGFAIIIGVWSIFIFLGRTAWRILDMTFGNQVSWSKLIRKGKRCVLWAHKLPVPVPGEMIAPYCCLRCGYIEAAAYGDQKKMIDLWNNVPGQRVFIPPPKSK